MNPPQLAQKILGAYSVAVGAPIEQEYREAKGTEGGIRSYCKADHRRKGLDKINMGNSDLMVVETLPSFYMSMYQYEWAGIEVSQMDIKGQSDATRLGALSWDSKCV